MSNSANKAKNLIVILGPTASGKTKLAAHLADAINSEIISADSRQVYRGMDIGTGKDYNDFMVNGKNVPYHLIDIVDPGEKYNVFHYQQDFFRIFENIHNRGTTPILCGGTGMYIDAVLRGYKLIRVPVNPDLRDTLKDKSLTELKKILNTYKIPHNKSDTDTKKRAVRAIEIADYYKHHPEHNIKLPEIHPLIIGVDISREKRRKRITERLHQRLKEGLVDEAQRLHKNGLSIDDMMYYGLEYKFLGLYLSGKITFSDMVSRLNIAIHQFAKRQMTWFRKMEKDGHQIHWIDAELSTEEKTNRIMTLLNA
ncbi:MAG: tRNA (adenosine(37)-N6)-dimethylallyltransferase MiaA [Candidatus Delongbacteria bacterium]|jgi:tRNA dimethylallyltransferase|nr:tRNA (adenosine(37)-N6)-dimethylallyltransferase MiaA [Candidatus Delongbacteria bacterium]